MASIISKANGNFTASTSWFLVDATSLLDTEAGNTALTTSYVTSSAFAPGAIVIDGIAVKIASRAASPTGTITVALYNSTDSVLVTGTELAINVSDLPACDTTANEGGWIFFKFASPVTLEAAHNYKVEAKTSSSSMVNLYRNGTAGNWARMLRVTTETAPAAGSTMHIIGEHTGAGTGNSFAIVMDQTATTDYGPGTDASIAITVGKRGTLNYGYTASTNYYLKCSGNVIVYNGGTFTIGTVANPIPRTGTAVLEFDPVADGGMGLIVRNGATFTAQGLSRTSGKNIYYCKLNTDEAVNSTSLGVDTDTGWLDNDEIAIAPTGTTYSEYEKGTMNGDAAAAVLTVDGFGGAGGGLAYAHDGDSPTQAEIILLTRNVKIRSATSTIMIYAYFSLTATTDLDWVEFYYLGENSSGKYGMEVRTTTGSFNMQYCSLHDCEDYGLYCYTVDNTTISYNCFYNLSSAGTGCPIQIAGYSSTPPTTVSFTYNVAIGLYAASYNGCYIGANTITITNNVIAGSRTGGFSFSMSSSSMTPYTATFSDNTIHSCAGPAMSWGAYGQDVLMMTNISAWNNQSACGFNGIGSVFPISIRGYSCTFFGNTSADIYFINNVVGNLEFHNSKLNSTTPVYSQLTTLVLLDTYRTYVLSSKDNQTAGQHKYWYRYGTISSDTVIYDGGSGKSQRIAPTTASYKAESGPKKVAVANGNTVTVGCKVRESVVGDGTDYNGARIRLIVKKNLAMGIAADTVLDTATVSSEGAFEDLSGVTSAVAADGVLEFVVDCDGTTGWVNVDTWTTS